ncbi:MAG: endolytic transglycosylase MltG [Candidatus Gracilibacteria bacterium]|nr:endolytic transglycosylase MltG [Candidatus Gracilibacteria bacterium]
MKKWIFVLFLCLVGYGWYAVSSVGSVVVRKGQVSIDAGTVFLDLGTSLKLGVSDWRLKAYRKYYAPEFELKSGTFTIAEDMSFAQALETSLKKPTHTDLTFMILPGWSSFDIDPYLAQKKFIKPGELIQAKPTQFPKLIKKYPFLEGKTSFEGFLYPDTYRIRPSADLEEFLDTLLGIFDERIYAKLTPAQQKILYSTLILASIVEREERNPDEKAVVAGVLTERLRIRMMLGADATLCYALELSSKTCTPSKIVDGLDSESPYNTRKVAGLPPTPISNPSRETWLATLFPKKSEALYYLHDPEGGIHYANTNEEHNANKRKYLK